jgi:DNA-binding NtrC family response regulator
MIIIAPSPDIYFPKLVPFDKKHDGELLDSYIHDYKKSVETMIFSNSKAKLIISISLPPEMNKQYRRDPLKAPAMLSEDERFYYGTKVFEELWRLPAQPYEPLPANVKTHSERLILPGNYRKDPFDWVKTADDDKSLFFHNLRDNHNFWYFGIKDKMNWYEKAIVLKKCSDDEGDKANLNDKEIVLLPYYREAELVGMIAPLFSDGKGKYRKIAKQNYEKVKKPFPFIGQSVVLETFFRQLLMACGKNGHCLIVGETGSGKEVTAEILHTLTFNKKPFIRINCATIQENIASSILFGHAKGAFTGADAQTDGVVKDADGGTLLLDEIQALPAQSMNMLLSFMENKQFNRMGDSKALIANTRIVAATNQDELLDDENLNKSGFLNRFRYKIFIPPLRYRTEDIKSMAIHFLEDLAYDIGMDRKAGAFARVKSKMSKQEVPGWEMESWENSNARGLKNAVYQWYDIRHIPKFLEIAGSNIENRKGLSDDEFSKILKRCRNSEELHKNMIYKGRHIYSSKKALIKRIFDCKSPNLKAESRKLRKTKFYDY